MPVYCLDASPAAQGASLTEGKKAKRGKKQDGRSGSPKQGSEGSENELDETNVSCDILSTRSSASMVQIVCVCRWVRELLMTTIGLST